MRRHLIPVKVTVTPESKQQVLTHMWRKDSFNTELEAMEVSAVKADNYVDYFKTKIELSRGRKVTGEPQQWPVTVRFFVTLQMLYNAPPQKKHSILKNQSLTMHFT